MRFFYIILLVYCSLIIACSSTDPVFPREEVIASELMPLEGITFPVRIEAKYPFLILQNIKRTDSLFHIYDLTSHELKNAFGVMGQGPDDYLGPWLFQTQLSDILIYDFTKNLIHQFGINEEGLSVFKNTKKPNFINGALSAAFINDSLYVLDAKHIAPSLYLLTLEDELPRKSWTYRNQDIIDYYSDPDWGNVYANEKRIVFCYEYKKQIDFMDIDFNLIRRVKFKYTHPVDIRADNAKKSYVSGYLGKRYLYVLFLGTSWNEHRDLSFHETFLEVYDLDGNPAVKYHLDGIAPVYFAVDEETFTLYGKGVDGDPEDNLLVYKLKGLS